MKIDNIELGNIFLAPMAGVTDCGFRKVARENGATFSYTEMISAMALKYNSKKTEKLLETSEIEKPCAVQIFGNDPEIMAEACQNPLLEKFDIIDINMGCPAPKIVKNGEGVSLMNNLDLAEKIIDACVNATKKPITVKMRLGFKDDELSALKLAKICENHGVKAITVHGRTHNQQYAGTVNYDRIKEIKENVNIKVIGSGDITDKKSYEKMKETGVDAVMIGRGSLGKPWIFNEINGKQCEDKIACIKEHIEELKKYETKKFLIKYLRKHMLWYAKNFNLTTQEKMQLAKMEDIDEAMKLFEVHDSKFI